VIGQSIEIVPAGLATVAPVRTKSEPIDIDPPVLLSTSWLAKAPDAAQNATAAAKIVSIVWRKTAGLPKRAGTLLMAGAPPPEDRAQQMSAPQPPATRTFPSAPNTRRQGRVPRPAARAHRVGTSVVLRRMHDCRSAHK